MEFNLNLSTSISDIIGYFQGNTNNISDEFEEGIFDNVLNKSFCDSDESEDMDYNLILNLLNNLKLFDNQEGFEDKGKIYTELEPVDSEQFSKLESISTIDKFNLIRIDALDNIYTNININEVSFNIEANDEYVEPKLLSSEELEILSKLENKFENKPEILSNNIEKIELSYKEMEVLKKVDDVVSESKVKNSTESSQNNKIDYVKMKVDKNILKNSLSTNKKFSQLENSDAMETLNLVKSEDLDNAYININESSLSIETNDYKFEQNLLSNEELVILNELQSKFKNKSEILNNNIGKIELSDKEIEVLKKVDDLVIENKVKNSDELFKNNKSNNTKLDVDKNVYKSNLDNNEKFSQLENSNTMEKLNLIRSDNLEILDKDLDTLESIVSIDENKFILNNNQLVNREINHINSTSIKDITTIRSDCIEDDIVRTVEYLKSSSKEIITMKITPKELGDMTIKLINDKDESSVVITISKSDVFDLVSDNQNEIVKHLKDLNIDIKEISIEMKNNTENNFSSNLSQDFARNDQRSKHGNKKNINLIDEEVDDDEEFYVEENINILI